MSVSFDGIGASNRILKGDSSHQSVSHLEPVKLDERKEVPVGSLGLGTALAVAYDLYNDTGIASQMASHIYSPQLTSFISLSSVKAPTAQVTQNLTPCVRPVPAGSEQPYLICSSQPAHLPLNNPVVWPVSSSLATSQSSQHSEAYLTPISVSDCSPKAFAVIADSNKLRFANSTSISKSADYPMHQIAGAYVQSAAPRTSSVTIAVDSSYPQSSTTSLSFCPSSSSCSSPSISTSSCAGSVVFGPAGSAATAHCMPVQTDMVYPLAVTTSISALSSTSPPVLHPIPFSSATCQRQQQPVSSSRPVLEITSNGTTNSISTGGSANDNSKSSSESSAFSADDSLYEITEEEMREIDASLANNPDVMASRQWKYYTETNEWTRATCALMACLFTRDQMANSTVLGRGGSQRARLPSNLVAYVVGTIRKRFNKPAAAVRARMAQKCKDERRFGRITMTGNGPIYTVDGTHEQPGVATPVAAISVKHSGSRRARKRPATSAGNSACTGTGTRPNKSSQSSSPLQSSSDFASTPGYQPTAYLDDACSSTTDSNQFPALALSPAAGVHSHSTDVDHDLYSHALDDRLQLPPVTSAPPTSLSMMLLLPSGNNSSSGSNSSIGSSHLDPIHPTDPSILSAASACHAPPSQSTELAS